jgi:DNA helicase-2/ATP-dependent DNA helicase PcrA
MYVAITRARTRLYLTLSHTRMLHGQTRYNVASRFLGELPQEVLTWITPRGGADLRPGRFDDRAWTAASPPPRYAATAAGGRELPFRIGQNVVHPKFGQGVIVSAEGSGSDARLQINFGRGGMKWLALEYAKLTPA